MTSFIVPLLVVGAVELCWARPEGAPSSTCSSMLPRHFANSSTLLIDGKLASTSPYTFNATWDDQRKYVRVSVGTGNLDVVAGFLIQGRTSPNGPAVGQFVRLSDSSNFKYQNCSAEKYGPNSSVTHTSSDDKKNLLFYWEPPFNQTGEVTFYATLAKSKEEFWVKLPSNSVSFDTRRNNVAKSANLSGFSTTDRLPATPTSSAIKSDSLGQSVMVSSFVSEVSSATPTSSAITSDSPALTVMASPIVSQVSSFAGSISMTSSQSTSSSIYSTNSSGVNATQHVQKRKERPTVKCSAHTFTLNMLLFLTACTIIGAGQLQ